MQTFTNEGTYTVFLDVLSASRNNKGKIDVLPLSTQVEINVKPKLGEIVLLVNGVNVSNLDSLKISPIIANQGIIFDPTASRAIGNGQITETTWTFGNGNSRTYKGIPSIEREIFATNGTFDVELQFKTNNGQNFNKRLQLIIRDPIAVISADKTTAHVGESISFRAESYLGDTRNVEYRWMIQDMNGNKNIKTTNGQNFAHTFSEHGEYIVTLKTKSPNGNEDSDSKIIKIESRDPIANLDNPKVISTEKPNTFVFDASKSYDPDTNQRKDLEYTWRIDEQKITLDNISNNGARGTYTFDSV